MPKIDTLFGFNPLDDNTETDYEIRKIKASKIVVLPQVRINFNEESIKELADSIREIGLQEPLTVRSDLRGEVFTLVNGERRYRALKLIAGDKFLDTYIECKIQQKEFDKSDVELLQLADNIVRENLSLLEQANVIKRLYNSGMMLDKIGSALGKSRAVMSKIMALADLPQQFLPLFELTNDYSLLYTLKTISDKYSSDEIDSFVQNCIDKQEITRREVDNLRKRIEGGINDSNDRDATNEINTTGITDVEAKQSPVQSPSHEPLHDPLQSPSQSHAGKETYASEDVLDETYDSDNYAEGDSFGGEKESKKTHNVSKILWFDKAADKLVCLLDDGRQVEVTASQIKVKI